MTDEGSNPRILYLAIALFYLLLGAALAHAGDNHKEPAFSTCRSQTGAAVDAASAYYEQACATTAACHGAGGCAYCCALLSQQLVVMLRDQPGLAQPTEYVSTFFPPTELKPPRLWHLIV